MMIGELDRLLDMITMPPKARWEAAVMNQLLDIINTLYELTRTGLISDVGVSKLLKDTAVDEADLDELEAVLKACDKLIATHSVVGTWLIKLERLCRKRRIELMAEEATASDGSDGEVL